MQMQRSSREVMVDSIAMNGGDGPNSYTQNSKYQEGGSNLAKCLISNSIQAKLIIENNSDPTARRVFSIADLGCSVGPNTFACVQTIIQAVELKFKTHSLDSETPEFQVFFNDNVTNDFNTLFKALPAERNYTAAGVPGSFHGRLFPEASMNFMHSAFALQYLKEVPEEVRKEGSPAWNKGRITYVCSSEEVVKAYRDEFWRGMEAFLRARSAELKSNGLLAILMPCRPEGSHPSDSVFMHFFENLGCVLTDMAKENLFSEALVDSFNLPIFFPSSSEVKNIIMSIEDVSIEEMDKMYCPPKFNTPESVRISTAHTRAAMEGILSKHFGSDLNLMDGIFQRFSQKLEEFGKTPRFTRLENFQNLYVLVKRNAF